MTKFIDLEARKSSTCKKIKQEEQELGCGDFGASRSIFLTILELLMVQIDRFRTSKRSFPWATRKARSPFVP